MCVIARILKCALIQKTLVSVRRLEREMTYINKTPSHRRSGSINPEPAREPEYPMRGLGDLVEKVTTKTGIKAVVDKVTKITGKDCGCQKRREALNKLAPFGKGQNNG